MQNKLIVLEGIDGVGKSSLSKALPEALIKKGIPTVRFEDIEEKTAGFNALKPFIKENVSAEASFFFYIASAIHKSSILNELLKKSWVVCDRYVFSTFADHRHKGVKIELDLDKLPIRKPDHFYLITLPEEERRRRITERGGVLTKEDQQEKIPGSRPFQFEEVIRSFKPTEVQNTGSFQDTLEKIVADILGQEK